MTWSPRHSPAVGTPDVIAWRDDAAPGDHLASIRVGPILFQYRLPTDIEALSTDRLGGVHLDRHELGRRRLDRFSSEWIRTWGGLVEWLERSWSSDSFSPPDEIPHSEDLARLALLDVLRCAPTPQWEAISIARSALADDMGLVGYSPPLLPDLRRARQIDRSQSDNDPTAERLTRAVIWRDLDHRLRPIADDFEHAFTAEGDGLTFMVAHDVDPSELPGLVVAQTRSETGDDTRDQLARCVLLQHVGVRDGLHRYHGATLLHDDQSWSVTSSLAAPVRTTGEHERIVTRQAEILGLSENLQRAGHFEVPALDLSFRTTPDSTTVTERGRSGPDPSPGPRPSPG